MATRVKVRQSVFVFTQMADALTQVRQREPVARLGLRALRNLRLIGPDAEEYVKRQVEYLDKYAQRDDSGGYKTVPGRPGMYLTLATEEASEAARELAAAGAEEIEYDLELLDLADLDALGPMPSSVTDALEPLIREDEGQAE